MGFYFLSHFTILRQGNFIFIPVQKKKSIISLNVFYYLYINDNDNDKLYYILYYIEK